MEKHRVTSNKQRTLTLLGDKREHSNANPFNAVPVNRGTTLEATFKLSREEVSRCITIWAKFYRYEDDGTDASELCLPQRPWLERS